MNESIITDSLQHIWFPCSQMQDYEHFKPMLVVSAEGSYINLADGKKLIDAISSWWCKSLGHNHPRLKKAIARQMEKFEHVILANTTNDTIAKLSAKLASLTNSLDKVFYASDGSSAVEIALKMSLHSRQVTKEPHRTKFISLTNSYHGETLATLSISDVGLYKAPYPQLLDCGFIKPPYVHSTEDPKWDNCDFYWQQLLPKLTKIAHQVTAVVVEPILQGAGGMQIYSQDFLKKLKSFCLERNIHLIADEIMTGIARTGYMLACEHADIEADFVCLGKGLTAGCLPLSAVLTKNSIYELFYGDHNSTDTFMHSHTYSGNALAASCALETLQIIKEEQICSRVRRLSSIMYESMLDIAEQTKRLINVRGIGAMVAADLICEPGGRLGFAVYKKACEMGVLLRNLGNTIYWLPPLNVEMETLERLKVVTLRAVKSV